MAGMFIQVENDDSSSLGRHYQRFRYDLLSSMRTRHIRQLCLPENQAFKLFHLNITRK